MRITPGTSLPHPVGRVSWTNYANLAPKTASKLAVRDGDYIKVTANGATIEVPVHVRPGDVESVAIESGWGRKHVGRVGDGVGGNAFALCAVENGMLRTMGDSVWIEKNGGVRSCGRARPRLYRRPSDCR